MRKIVLAAGLFVISLFPAVEVRAVSPEAVMATIGKLSSEYPDSGAAISKGVEQVADLWRDTDGTDEQFAAFCSEYYIGDAQTRYDVFLRISDYVEDISGYYNRMALRLQKNVTLETGPIYPVDYMFGAYNPRQHHTNDMFDSKIAFVLKLNFPRLMLEEKNALPDDRLLWAYARMGDMYNNRPDADKSPAEASAVSADADRYIDAYNIHMHSLVTTDGRRLFPEGMSLLCHWNLRDEIKANYSDAGAGHEKQRMVYEVIKRIVSQQIPAEVINSSEYDWDPYTNVIFKDGQVVAHHAEDTVRYSKLINNFVSNGGREQDNGRPTFMQRTFDDGMEMDREYVERVFRAFMSAPELKQVAAIISQRLGRPLEAYDIWYDGFKSRSSLDMDMLDRMTRTMYPDAPSMERDIPNILMKLGFPADRAQYIAEKIAVDPARGSGHAWGAAMKGQQARLRTRIGSGGMDYKGYNIAVHELGHNVEQTISLYDVDYYMLEGVPNTSFTEALAFVFQKRDLDILGIVSDDPMQERMDILDKVWSLYEICGMALFEMEMWKWMYENPYATAAGLREHSLDIAKGLWNRYYAPVLGVKDEIVLGIYSHMINHPLYLSNYAFGHMLEFQIEKHLEGKDFAREVSRIYKLGRLTPTRWMMLATGESVSAEPMLAALRDVLNELN